ncbi:MAG: hypothetical protein IT236_04490 [Bacteroidia bacterium]|nr:hypothetical protein [Bacteroidia bacterium]
MTKRISIKSSYILLLFFVVGRIYSQCNYCDVTVNSNAVSAYTVGSGQRLCVSPGCVYSGTITLQGGTLCNDGTINRINFGSGTFNNYGTYSSLTGADVSLNTSGKLVINNFTGAKFIVKENLIINSAGQDSLYINNFDGAALNVSNSFTINGAKTKINIGLAATTCTNNTFITSLNINGDFVINPATEIALNETGFLNVTGVMNLLGAGSKTISNKGEISVSGNFMVSGNGANTTTISINNYSSLSINESFSCNISSAVVKITNHTLAGSEINIGGNWNQSTSGFTLTNGGLLDVGVVAYLTNGVLINDKKFNSRSIEVESGAFTNNNLTILTQDLYISGTSGVVNNNGSILVQKNFTNKGTVNLAKKSVITALNFDNQLSGSVVNGSANLLNESSTSDNSYYPRIIVAGFSKTSGYLNNNLLIADLSYSGEGTFRVDQVDEGSYNDPLVITDHVCEFDLEVGVLYAMDANGGTTRSVFCPGESLTLVFNPYVPIVSGPTWTFTGTYGNGSMSAGPPYNFVLNNITTNGLISVSGVYYNGVENCNFTFQFSVAIGNGSLATTSPVYFGIGNNVTLSSTVTLGSAPYQFTTMPNVFFPTNSSNLIQNPIVVPEVSLTYTLNVLDAFGCTASNTIMVIAEPFALLDKSLNGEYYTLFNNQLFFKYDGQYDNTALNYTVYNSAHSVMPLSSAPVNISTVVPGDNRYVLNATSLAVGAYVLEVINEKKEKLYLRFKR